jgi:signal transduction histidine kinase
LRGEYHDLANLFTVISSFAELGEESACDRAAARRYFGHIRTAAATATGLVGRLTRVAQDQPGEAPSCDLETIIIRQTTALFDSGKSRCWFLYDADKWIARVEGLDVWRVLANLLKNACDAYETLEPRHACDPINITLERSMIAGSNAREIHLKVKDWAGGMTEETRERLLRCEPVTTKGAGRGSGLSRIVWPILIRAGGRLEIETRLGEGSTFTAVLPAAE